MVRINLLPEEFRPRKRRLRISRRWGYLAASVVGVFLILLFLTIWQRSRLGRLETEIRQTQVEAERQKADLRLVRELNTLKEKILQRMQVVEQLNQNRNRWIEIMTALSQSVPGDIWLVSFKENGSPGGPQARIQGMSFSLKPIALFMNRLNESQWFSHSQFTYARRIPVPKGMAYDFEIVAHLFSYEKRVSPKAVSSQEDLKKGKSGKEKNKKG